MGPTLPAKERLAAAQAVLSSLQAAEPLQVRHSKRLQSSYTHTYYMPNAYTPWVEFNVSC